MRRPRYPAGAAPAASSLFCLFSLFCQFSPALAADPGISDSEVVIGNTVPYSGPVSAYGTVGKAIGAYFKKINDDGGVNGRRIRYISVDDAYSPPKTVEQVRRLVEQDEVFALVGLIGSASNAAIQKYTNGRKVPVLFVGSASDKSADPANFPWTMPWIPSASQDAAIFAKWLLKEKPKARVAVIYQNDDFGKDYLRGFKAALGDSAAAMVVKEASYEVTDPTLDSQVIQLKDSGADTLFQAATPKFSAMAIRKVFDIGWRPTYLITYQGSGIETALRPAGLEKCVGILSAYFGKTSPEEWKDDPEFKEYLAVMKKYYPDGDVADAGNPFGYGVAWAFVDILRKCGRDCTRERLMKAATSLDNAHNPILLPGITLTTGPTDYHPIEQSQMRRFDGKTWSPIGPVISSR